MTAPRDPSARPAGSEPRAVRPGEGIVIVNFAAGDGRIGCRFGCPYCIWERSPEVAVFTSPPQGALDDFVQLYATETLAINGGGDPLHDLEGAGGRELDRILRTAKAWGRRTTVRTRDASALLRPPARHRFEGLVDRWKLSAPVGLLSAAALVARNHPGSEVSIVVSQRDDPERVARTLASYAKIPGTKAVLQGDYNDPEFDDGAWRGVAERCGAEFSPAYFSDAGTGKAFLVGSEVRIGNSMDPACAAETLPRAGRP